MELFRYNKVQERVQELAKILSGEEERDYRRFLESSQQKLRESEIILSGREQAIAYLANKGDSPAAILRATVIKDINPKYFDPGQGQRVAFVQKHPQWLGKVYIYLSIGGKFEPHPRQSYPSPEFFEVNQEFTKSIGYHVHPKEGPGFSLHHEVAHYETDEHGITGEYESDRIAYERLMKAWQKFQETGDSSGYPFVFVTPEGITITKRPPDKRTPETSV